MQIEIQYTTPVHLQPHFLNIHKEVNENIGNLIEKNLVKDVKLPVHASLYFLLKNHDKTKKNVIMYSDVKAKIKVDVYSVSNLDVTITGMAQVKWYSCLDIRQCQMATVIT